MCRETGSLLETWILMELADRGSLSDALRAGRFPTHDFTAIFRCLLDIASGAALHLRFLSALFCSVQIRLSATLLALRLFDVGQDYHMARD